MRLVVALALVLAGGAAHATPRWRYTDAAEWVDARLPAASDSASAVVASAAEARTAVAANKPPGLITLWVTPANVCAVAPGLAGAGARLSLNIEGVLTKAAAACVSTIAPAALTVATGAELPVLPALRALAIITATDAELSALSGFRTLESLAIGHGVTDQGLGHLASMRGLRALELSSADAIVGTGIGKLAQLRSLALKGMTVTPAQLAGVGVLTGLRTLELVAGVDGDDLAAIARLTKLHSLTVRGDALPAGLAPIGKLAALRTLVIVGTELEDGQVAALQRWSKKHRRVKVRR